MSQPIVPPRPQRAQAGPTAVNQQTPQIPPRPVRKTDPSPAREANTRSPFNEPPTAMSNWKIYGHSNLSASELPPRPPSVASMPTVGQEGSEYASYDQLPPEAHGVSGETGATASATVQQTRHADVPMQQPKASVPLSTAASRITTVTRTDSSQAAAAGIGKPRHDETPNDSSTNLSRVTSRETGGYALGRVSSREPHPLRVKSSFNRSSSSLPGGRPGSMHDDEEREHGIPEIGLQVPMYPNAGDVQAPSPSPYATQFPAGIGFFNDGSSRNHQRKRSSRQEFGPPGSYGLHGHPGQEPGDQFERDWLAKHPDAAAKEGYNAYGGLAPRPSTAMSSDQLNRLVSENKDVGFGTSRGAVGTPSQEIGWEATEQYASRMASPKPSPAPLGELKKRPSSGAQPPVESPLRKTSFPMNQGSALDSEDEGVYHIEGRAKAGSKVTGGGVKDNKLDLGPNSGNTPALGGVVSEEGFGIPILASDEVMKRPGSAYLQPAISPEAERSDFFDEGSHSRRGSAQPLSRPTSRPNSMHGGYGGFHGGLSRFVSHDDFQGSGHGTPLEEIEEYEPLFPEDDDKKKAMLTEKLKKARPGLAQHHFPSQDVWEDTPASLQFTTSVDTPEPPPQEQQQSTTEKSASMFESPEQEQQRKQNGETMLSDNKTFAKPHFKAGVQSEHERPGVNRFPSQDIWEDTPNIMRLETTVSGPQEPEIKSPPEDRPTTTALPGSQDDEEARATTGMSQLMRPHVPTRPQRSSKLSQDITPEISSPQEKEDPREREVPDLGEAKSVSPTKTKAPSIPDRPKPTVPARPAKYAQGEPARAVGAPLDKSTSDEGVTSPPAPKAKPAVPARPAGNKFANLKSGFMSDLASRIQLGPQGPAPKVKSPEAEEEVPKEPLVDARKSRAKGPARRKPAASPSGAAAIDAKPASFSFSSPTTLWHIDEADALLVPTAGLEAAQSEPAAAAAEKAFAENEASNALSAAPASSKHLEASPAVSATTGSLGPATPNSERSNPLGTPANKAHTDASVGHLGDIPDASISPAVQERTEAVQPGLESALAQAEPAPANAEEAQAKIATEEVGEAKKLNAQDTAPAGKEVEGGARKVGETDPEMQSTSALRDGEEVARAGAD